MKKFMALLMALSMLLCLCACGGGTEDPAPEAAPEEAASEANLAEEEAPAPAEEPASGGNVILPEDEQEQEEDSVNREMFELARSCIGLGPDDLFAAIGEPDSDEYTSSCLEENAEDGALFYNEYGFYVWTLRYTDGREIIQDVIEL